MKRVGLVILHAAFAIALSTTAWAAEPLALNAIARKLHPDKPALDRVGALQVRGILELSSPDSRFGGLSGLLISPDGTRLEAVTDQGHWITARLRYNGRGHLEGLDDGRIAPLVGPDGRALAHKRQQDAESLAAEDGALLISFEHDHRIWAYRRQAGQPPTQPTALPPPPGLAGLPANDGLEAIETMGAEGLLAIASKSDGGGRYPAYLRRGESWQRLWYERTAPYEPTGAARLPDGDLLVLERRFSLLGGLGIRLVRLARDQLVVGGTLRGQELAELTPPLTIDNLEGVATRRGAAGETLIYLVSDDNFNPLQRTLLLLFALEE